IYDTHYSAARTQTLLAAGGLVRGVLRVNPKSRGEAYVALDETPSSKALQRAPELQGYGINTGNDVYICGDVCRNRAVSGDVVAIRLLSKAETARVYKANRLADDRRKDRATAQRRARLADMSEQMGTAKGEDDARATGPRIPELFGAVVAIIIHDGGRTYAGSLSTMAPASAKQHGAFLRSVGRGMLWFRPLSADIPVMAVPAGDVPEALRGCRGNQYCTVRMCGWAAAEPVPRASFVAEIGGRGGLEAETLLILAEHGVNTEPAGPDVVRCLPAVPWSIPAADLARRTDLRGRCVFTIDPASARDLDDAVSCERLPGGRLLVGVHIADVSYFVRPDTALDRHAQALATTTYMVQRAYPMLPAVLCEDLCSLSPGVDRLAFSVMWEVEPASGAVCATWFGRTVIHSACKLSYDDAQAAIEGRGLPDAVACGRPREEVEAAIGQLDALARVLRKQRFDAGALSLNNVKLAFELDAGGAPVGCRQYPIRDSNRLIEEFMLLANMSVAARVEASFPGSALLRRHPPPLPRRLDAVCERLRQAGVDIESGSAGAISRSLGRIADAGVRQTVEEMLTAPMQRASYFATSAIGDRSHYRHYALNVPLYTHFTSPIRRYADIVVHRALEASLGADGHRVASDHPLLPARWSPYFPATGAEGSLTTSAHAAPALLLPSADALVAIAHRCNQRKGAAKAAQDASMKLYLAYYLGASGVIAQGVVTNIGENGITFATPQFGVDGTVYMDRMADTAGQVVSADGREWRLKLWSVDADALQLVWDAGPGVGTDTGADPGASPGVGDDGGDVDRLAGRLGALSVGGAAGTVTHTVCVFSRIAVMLTADLCPPRLETRLVMPAPQASPRPLLPAAQSKGPAPPRIPHC
ncbi:Translational repressor, partial [Coemansia spiralis]